MRTVEASEFNEVPVVSFVCLQRRSQDDPVVLYSVLDRPTKVINEERDRPFNPPRIIVVQDQDASPANQAPKIEQVQEDCIEAVVAIDES